MRRSILGGAVFVAVFAAVMAGLSRVACPTWLAAVPILIISALAVFGLRSILERSRPGTRPIEVDLKGMASTGCLASCEYRARRALQIEELEDEGSHYVLELEDGSVRYFTGPHFCEYEPCENDPELSQPRRFPCTEFTVHRHRKGERVVHIDCRGTVLEPEVLIPATAGFSDDEVLGMEGTSSERRIEGATYDEVKATLLARSARAIPKRKSPCGRSGRGR
jgi:hypothetical protein